MTTIDELDQTSELTDASKRLILQEAGLFINDPSSYPGLSAVLDPKVGLDHSFRSVAYDTTVTTQEKVRCSICAQRQLHNHGFIVRIATGEVGLVGRDCGEHFFFGEDGWKLVETNSRIASERAIFERRWGPAKIALEKVIPLAQMWATRIRAVNQLQSEFESALPELWSAIAAKLHDGKLSTEKRNEVPYEDRNGDRRVRIEYVPMIVCDVGAGWFFHETSLHQNLQRQILSLQKCLGQLNANMDSRAVVALSSRLRDIRKNMEDIAAQQALLPKLFNDTTWEKIAKWARAEKIPPANYRFKNGRLKSSDDQYDYGSLPIPALPVDLTLCWDNVRSVWPRL